ncbi:transposase [Arthrobacter sp. UYCu712]|uniref:IS110 family transposase n=1 Tax=Arthrobacter sp. UYCu712 TaxID=3156340 RepID=UPI003393B4A0
MIVIGIDPHKSSITAAAIDPSGNQLAVRRFVVNSGTTRQLLGWAAQWPERRFAIEGANGLGRGTAQILVAHEEHVVDVPSTLAMKVRVLSTGGGRKSDPADAFAVAVTALRQVNLRPVAAEDQTTILRLLAERRDDLGHERARLLNRLHRLLRELIPGGVEPGLSATKAGAALRRVRPRP